LLKSSKLDTLGDNKLSHITELIKSFVQKLNLLKSLHFLSKLVRLDVYYEIIFPAVTYGDFRFGDNATRHY
jgi:hypothetical protein